MSHDLLAEVASLAQVHSEHVNDLNWENLYRAVVCHLAGLPSETAVIIPRARHDQVCPDILMRYAGCTGWHRADACDNLWHPECLQILIQDTPTWVWMPRLIVCRQHQHALGIHPRHNQALLKYLHVSFLRKKWLIQQKEVLSENWFLGRCNFGLKPLISRFRATTRNQLSKARFLLHVIFQQNKI